MEKAKKAEKVISRTCKPKFNGLRYIPSIMKGGKLIAVHKHIDSGNISDQEALDLLDAGILKESDFEVLPEKYASKKQKAKQSKKS